jgi:hypothetical protein
MKALRPVSRPWLIAALILWAATAYAAGRERDPYAGYVYPAGGRQGTTLRVTVGGQNLMGAALTYVSGEGVKATVIEHVKPLTKKQLGEIAQVMREVARKRMTERSRPAPAPPAAGTAPAAGTKPPDKPAEQAEVLTLPDHPWLRGIENMTLEQLQDLRARLYNPKLQPNSQIAEWVIVDVTIDASAKPGDRELWVATPNGLTNPIRFAVGAVPEVEEKEPNDTFATANGPVSLPALLTGQVMPGDVDYFRFKARRGQKLVLQAKARHLTPYLADTVPGWFQAVLTLYDAQGKELVCDDDYRFDPDPVLLFQVPQEGEYVLQIRDSIYRGREDFIYRISVGEQPFITSMFPLGGREGTPTLVSVEGWNLPWKQVQLDTQPGQGWLREASWSSPAGLSNTLTYAVDALPETSELEPNDIPAQALRVTPPQIINGHISHPGDLDTFRLEAAAGEELVAEVAARRLGSPLDSLLRVLDATGKVLAFNDDNPEKETGLLTHHADSYVRFRFPKAGTYFVQLSDTEQHGGEDFGYRLRLGPPQPDFALRISPSSLSVSAGRTVTLTVAALRKDGFTDAIDLALRNNTAGFVLGGARIPAGHNDVRLTLTAPVARFTAPLVLQMEGRAVVGGKKLVRPVVPAEDMMQAFAYRHLVPVPNFLVAVTPARVYMPAFTVPEGTLLRIPPGGTVQLQVPVAAGPQALAAMRFELSEPPKGLTLQSATTADRLVTFTFKAEVAAIGTGDNLIVEAFAEVSPERFGGKPGSGNRRMSMGILPAIPFEVIKN